jgi:hypothetical protein
VQRSAADTPELVKAVERRDARSSIALRRDNHLAVRAVSGM